MAGHELDIQRIKNHVGYNESETSRVDLRLSDSDRGKSNLTVCFLDFPVEVPLESTSHPGRADVKRSRAKSSLVDN